MSEVDRIHTTVSESPNQVTVAVYEDGDVVVTNELDGGCVSLADRSGFGPLFELCHGLELDDEDEEAVLDFVTENTGFFT